MSGQHHEQIRKLRAGVRWYDDTGVLSWVCIEPHASKEAALEAAFSKFPDVLPSAHYYGPGRSFAHEPFVRLGKYRTIITVNSGLDV